RRRVPFPRRVHDARGAVEHEPAVGFYPSRRFPGTVAPPRRVARRRECLPVAFIREMSHGAAAVTVPRRGPRGTRRPTVGPGTPRVPVREGVRRPASHHLTPPCPAFQPK